MYRALALVVSLAACPAFAQSARNLNSFGLDLQRESAKAEPTRNIMTSPLALYQALGMALNGTAGSTRELLTRALGGEAATLEGVNLLNSNCQAQLNSTRPDGSKLLLIQIANAGWDSAGFGDDGGLVFAPEYIQALKTSYRADVGSLDFTQSASAGVINDLAKEKTFGLIPTVVGPEEIHDLIFLLMNTSYFEGTWATGFTLMKPGQYTAEYTKFATEPGKEKHVTVIHKRASYGYQKTADEEIVEIPFVSPEGRDFVFYAVLPKRGQSDLAPYWNDEFWTKTLSSMKTVRYAEGEVTMPKFSFDFDLKMTANAALTRAMKLGFLFGDGADFSAMKTPKSPDAKVGLIKEITRIELDEKGVKAAAAVVVGGMRSLSIPKPAAFDVRFDRPFAFAIAEKVSGTLLFVGGLNDPEAGK